MTAEVPPRPEPPRRLVDTARTWLMWFGFVRLIVSAVCVVVVAGGVAWLVRAPTVPTEATLPFSATTTSTVVPTSTRGGATFSSPAVTVPPDGPVVVHVAGAVVRPGVVELRSGDRVQAAIEVAGGPTDSAELDGINLAATVVDGQRVYVPEAGEIDPASVPSGASGTRAVDPDDGAPVGPIDLNTATASQLETLPGVGPATAAAIVDDRARRGPFATVADLERVPGIGPAKLEAIADQVTV